jgi:predicted nucleotidyltransferase
MMNLFGLLRPCTTTENGANNYLHGLGLNVFNYQQALEVRDAFERYQARYLFLGKSGAVLLGFPDTTQDVDLFVEKSLENANKLVQALHDLEFTLTERQIQSILSGQDFVQLKNGPFDLDLIFAPDGIETFAEAWARQIVVDGFRVCNLDDIIASKEATGRKKDLESLPRLKEFRIWWKRQQ